MSDSQISAWVVSGSHWNRKTFCILAHCNQQMTLCILRINHELKSDGMGMGTQHHEGTGILMGYKWVNIDGYEIGIGCGDIVLPLKTPFDAGLIAALVKAKEMQPQIMDEINMGLHDPGYMEYRRNQLPDKIPDPTRKQVRQRDGFRCQHCDPFGFGSNTDVHIHHVLPISQGGNHDIDNLITLCVECHKLAHRILKATKS